MQEKLTFLRVSQSNIDEFAYGLSELYSLVYPYRGSRDPAFWRWRYFENPLRKGILIVALRGNRVVGMYGMIYLSLAVQGGTVRAQYMADYAINPTERSWRCYNGLIGMNYAEISKEDAALIFGITFSNLTKLNRLYGMVSLGHLPIYLGFLNIARILEKCFVPYPLSLIGRLAHPIMGLSYGNIKETGLCIRPIDKFDSNFDDLWSSLSENHTISIVKNSEYLNWRYGEYAGLGSGSGRLAAYRENRLEGLIIFCITGLSSHILELLVRDDNPEVMRGLLWQAFAKLREKNIGYVVASFPSNSQSGSVLNRLGFKAWGARFYFNPEIIIRSPSKKSSPEFDLKNWYFSLGDWMTLNWHL